MFIIKSISVFELVQKMPLINEILPFSATALNGFLLLYEIVINNIK